MPSTHSLQVHPSFFLAPSGPRHLSALLRPPPSPRKPCRRPPQRLTLACVRKAAAPGYACFSGGIPDPADADPIEIDEEEDDETLTKFDRVVRESRRLREQQQGEYERNKAVFMEAVGLHPEAEEAEVEEEVEEGVEIIKLRDADLDREFLAAIGETVVSPSKVASMASKQEKEEEEAEEELAPEEEGDLEEILKLENGDSVDKDAAEEENALADPSFIVDYDFEEQQDLVKEPTFQMTLGELLDEAHVVPVLVNGDLDVEIGGIQQDAKQIKPGDMFVCCTASATKDGDAHLAEAAEKGAVVIVVNKEVSVKENMKAVVFVEDIDSIISALAAAFYGNPSQKLAIVGVTGTNGKMTTSYLLKNMYEAMGIRTGLLCSIENYINGKAKLDAPNNSLDAVSLQKLMATMVHNGTEICIMEVSSRTLSQGQYQEVDFDVAVFTNLRRDSMDDFHKSEGEYREAKGRLFAKMIDSDRQRKVVNIDDPNAAYFLSLGHSDVPVVTFSMDKEEADVFPYNIKLSLFETEILVRTPRGNIEISSGLLGRQNVYNILAAVAVGVAVEAPLEDVVRGIEEVDAVPGRCELIDEEQAFAVVIDHARTPDTLSRLLDTVRECGARRIITVVGCEGNKNRGKRPVMTKIATDKSDVCILTSDNPGTEDPLYILDDMLAGVGWSMDEYLKWGENDYYPPLRNGHRLFVYDIRNIAVRAAVAMGEEGDAVVIAGRGHETFHSVGEKAEYLDDREECREALQHVDALHAAGIDTSEFPWRVPESH